MVIYKKLRCIENPEEKINNDAPILLVYEEAHKYVPNSDLSKYRSSNSLLKGLPRRTKIWRHLLLASQRPSEISETILHNAITS